LADGGSNSNGDPTQVDPNGANTDTGNAEGDQTGQGANGDGIAGEDEPGAPSGDDPFGTGSSSGLLPSYFLNAPQARLFTTPLSPDAITQLIPGAESSKDDNAPPAAKLAQWAGRWDGTMDYQYLVGVEDSILTGPHDVFETRQMSVALRIDDLDYDPANHANSVTARVAVGDCLLSAVLEGSIFFGDDLSPIANPILSLQAAGSNSTGQFLAMRANATRSAPIISGTLNFEGVDTLQAPCGQKDMPFRVTRTSGQ
jgi:hypothetical protein